MAAFAAATIVDITAGGKSAAADNTTACDGGNVITSA
jgi:hypothetical protein